MNNSATHQPGLFGITHSNRDFSQKQSWGKNQFNNSFPVALASYMGYK
ncbi:MAG: HindVP family restriction endonuclease, partial [Chroococcales cyanobacterium]